MKTPITFFRRSFQSILLLSLFLISKNVSAQKYLEITNKSKSKNFEEITKEVEKYYSVHGLDTKEVMTDEGSEYNQYQRWKYFNKSRLMNGKLQNTNKRTLEAIELLPTSMEPSSNGAPFTVKGRWTSLGPTSAVAIGDMASIGIGRISCIAIDPANSKIIYVGAPAGGLWRSTNGGTTWAPLTDSYLATIGVSGIAIDPTSPAGNRTIYILTGDGDAQDIRSIGVLKSTNNGISWNATGLKFSNSDKRFGYKLLIHPTDNHLLFAATDTGIYKTTNGGASWTLSPSTTPVTDIEFRPFFPQWMFAVNYNFLMRSTDFGKTWTNLTSGIPHFVGRKAIAVTPANPSMVYLLDGNTTEKGKFGGLYRSKDGGLNFTVRSTSPNILDGSAKGDGLGSQLPYDLAFVASTTNEDEIYSGGIYTWRSLNGGISWTRTSYGVVSLAGPGHYSHPDVHALEYNNGTVYCGNDGGIYKSTNAAKTWSDISSGLDISQIYRIGVDQSNANRTICGAQDNGMNILTNKVYNQWVGSDGFEGFVDPVTPATIYGEGPGGALVKSIDNGKHNFGISPPHTTLVNWNTAFVMDPKDHKTLYSGYSDIWKSTDAGAKWTNLTNGIRGNSLADFIAVAPSNNKVIYAYKSGFIRTKDAGANWVDRTSSMNKLSSVTFLAVSPKDQNEVWMTGGGYENGEKVYTSTDGGDSWTNVSGSLPNIPVNCIVFQKGTTGVYIGTDAGVYYRDHLLSDWVLYSLQLPRTIVTELEIYYPTKKLRAATYGRGVWETDLHEQSIPPVVNITNPLNGSAFNSPTRFTIKANATDIDGSISKVEFFNGNHKLGEDLTFPYEFTWTVTDPDRYRLIAKATDNDGIRSTSSTVNVTVTRQVNLALHKPAVTSSSLTQTMTPDNAVDGNMDTHWSSKIFGDPEWIYVDLGNTYAIEHVKIYWGDAYAKNYKIQIFQSGKGWRDMKSVFGNTSLANDWTGLSGTGRFIRILCTSKGTAVIYSINELEVYGHAAQKPELARSAVPGASELSMENVSATDSMTFAVSPNPVVNGSMTLSFNIQKEQDVKITISNLVGKEIILVTKKAVSGLNSFEIAVQDIPNGIYVVNLSNEGFFTSKKIVINKE